MLVIIKAIVELRDDPWAVVNIAMMIGMIYYLKKTWDTMFRILPSGKC